MTYTEIKKQLEDAQAKLSEYALEEAKYKAEKAAIELETAKLQQAYILKMMSAEPSGISKKRMS